MYLHQRTGPNPQTIEPVRSNRSTFRAVASRRRRLGARGCAAAVRRVDAASASALQVA
jgi:hypothetical protein